MKTIVITGSTDGIGKLAAIKLAKEGHQVILHGRNPEKLEQTLTEVKTASNNENIHSIVADFSNFNSIDKMIINLQENYSKIDILINNAGVFYSKIHTNQDGFDLRFAVNYFAPYSADKGAQILYDLAILEKHVDRSGQYFDNDKGSFNKAHADAYNPKKIAQLITETKQILRR